MGNDLIFFSIIGHVAHGSIHPVQIIHVLLQPTVDLFDRLLERVEVVGVAQYRITALADEHPYLLLRGVRLFDGRDSDATSLAQLASQLGEARARAEAAWAEAAGYAARVTGLFGFFYGVVAYPIACDSYDPTSQFAETCVSALVGASGATAAMVLNMYNGWSYVRDRLLSATVEYEETGWYDGQVYVKDPEMLARDRLLGTYTVRPVVEMLRKTLIGCGATAMISLLALRVIDAPSGQGRGDFGAQQGYYSETSAAKYEEDEEEEEDMEQMQASAFRWSSDADAPAIEISRE